MENRILVVAGMHRSGTSVLSQWLSHCGLNLGERLLGAGVGNVEGHFEDLDFLDFHEQTLKDSGLSGFGYVHEPIANLSVYQKEKLRSIIGFKNQLHKEWGWKEPRTCLFLDTYRELIPGAYYLIIIRDYRETVSSLIKRDYRNMDNHYASKSFFSRLNWKRKRSSARENRLFRLKSEFYLKVWITYNEAVLKTIQSLPAHQFIVTDHRLLADHNTTIFHTLVNHWNFNLQYADFSKIYKKTLLSEITDIDTYVADRNLVQKARELETEIKSYIR